MANLNSESYHFLIGFVTLEYLVFLKLHVIPRFTGTGILPVPVNRNRGILTSLMFHCGPVAERGVGCWKIQTVQECFPPRGT
jgi:hypothetical protein